MKDFTDNKIPRIPLSDIPPTLFITWQYIRKSAFSKPCPMGRISRLSHLMRYWHIGRSRKARATVAITAVQEAKSIWKVRANCYMGFTWLHVYRVTTRPSCRIISLVVACCHLSILFSDNQIT